MKPKESSESKMQSAKIGSDLSPGKKRMSEIQGEVKKSDASILKKNEFTMIFLGAFVLTLVVFFFFFRAQSPAPAPAGAPAAVSAEFEKRMEKMEHALQAIEKSASTEAGNAPKEKAGGSHLEDRVAKLETAFSVKMESMLERMGKIEKHISLLAAKQEAAQDQQGAKSAAAAAASPASPPAEKKGEKAEKGEKKEKPAQIFHTVQKGETLFSISQKYKTSVEALKKMNNMSNDTAIYPGNNLLIR